jgi:predicted ATPase
MLVVLDNCEHLIDECARLLDVLMTHTKAPRFLVTSREAVNISGEAVFSTPSLPFPQATATLEEITGSDSVRLFRDRVLMNKRDFELDERNGPIVSSICQKLDGIPLAIEMAASRVKVMDPETILSRLSDQFKILSSGVRTAAPRHQTLQATIDWSNDLLTEEEQILFHRLSIFAGDFDLEGAEQICGFDPLSEPQVLDLLAQLVDKSLLVTVEEDRAVRYTLLEITKQYGREKLSEKGELNALQDHYCDYYLAKTRVGYEERLEHSIKWFGWLQRELYNLQGALSILQNDPQRSLELASFLGEFFYLSARLGIGREILSLALANCSHRDANRARALSGLGLMEVWFLDFEAGLAKMDESFEIIEEIDDDHARVNLYYQHGMVKTINKEWDEAKRIQEEGLRISQSLGDPWLELRYKTLLNWIPINQLQPDLIEDDIKECLQEAKKKGTSWDITGNRHMYADVALQKGNFRLSEKRYIEAAESALGYQITLQLVIEMQGIAMSVAGQGRHEKGLRLFGASMAKFEELGAQMVQLDFWITCINRTIGKAMETVGAEKAQSLNLEGRQMGFERAIEYAFDVKED